MIPLRPQPMTEREKLGAAVRMTLEHDGISLESFAAIIGKSRSYLTNLLNGKRDVSFDTWVRIAASLNTTVGELLNVPQAVLDECEAQRQLRKMLPRKPNAGKAKLA